MMYESVDADQKCQKCELALSCDIPFKRLFEQAEESMWIVQNNRFITSNHAACRQFQIDNIEAFIGLHPSQISPPLQPDGTLSDLKANIMMENAVASGYCRFEWLHQKLDGTIIPMEITLTAIKFAGVPALFAVGRDITHIKDTQRKLHHLANHDPLTGLANRRNFEKSVICEISHCTQAGDGFSILFIDLDNFKVINDGLGHSVGDRLLTLVANRLKTRISDYNAELFRLGGDEFVVIYVRDAKHDLTTDLASSIIQGFSDPFKIGEHVLHITSSIGIATYPEHGESYSELLKNADAAMYCSKGVGKNRFVVFDQEIAINAQERLVLEQELRKAIDEQNLLVHYQPIYNSKGEIKGAEALIRWKHQTKGLILPNQFISLAEDTGLIIPMGQWLQKRVISDLQEFLVLNPRLEYVSINVSTRELEASGFASYLTQLLRKSRIDSRYIMLEITESGLIQEFERFNKILLDIRARGLKLSIDDFGTGYSSLRYLKELPVHQLKLDRSFITELKTNKKDLSIVKSIVALAEALGLDTLAEGIEDEDTKILLTDIGCTLIQGFLFSKPLPKHAFVGLMQAT